MNTTVENNDNAQALSMTFIGTLKVHYVNGRYGPFPVGTLFTDIGNFTVRDNWLETLQEGEYQGKFDVLDLSLYSYRAFGEVRTSIKATIESYYFDDYHAEYQDDQEMIPDPIEEDLSSEDLQDFKRESLESENQDEKSDEGQDMSQFVALLASHSVIDWWDIGDDYRIDSTLSRADIVKCKQALQALGYEFEPQAQLWRIKS